MYRCHLYDNGFFIISGLLQGVHQLAQILNGVNIMVRGGGYGVRPLRHHAGAGDISNDFRPGQMAADAGLGPLAHLDLDGGAGLQVLLVYAEASGSHLDDGVFAVCIKILMQTALAGVIADTQLPGRTGQAGVGIIADGSIAHGGEHHRHG